MKKRDLERIGEILLKLPKQTTFSAKEFRRLTGPYTNNRAFERFKKKIKNLYTYSNSERSYSIDPENLGKMEGFIKAVYLIRRGNLLKDFAAGNDKLNDAIIWDRETNSDYNNILETILSSIEDGKKLLCSYAPFNKESKKFEIAPHAVKEYNGRWYLYGVVEKVSEKGSKKPTTFTRTLALDRIKEVTKTDNTFKKPIAPAIDFRDYVGITLDGGPCERVELAFTKDQAPYIESLPWHKSQNRLKIEDPDWVHFSFEVVITYEFKEKIFQKAPCVKVIAPEALRKDVMETLQKNLNLYQ